MFLTPDGKPIVGGTYWPREDKKDRWRDVYPGFKTILKAMHDAYKEKTPRVRRSRPTSSPPRTEPALANAGVPGIAIVDARPRI